MPENSGDSKSLHQDLWAEAVERFRQNVSPGAFAQIVEIHSLEDLLRASAEYKVKYRRKKLPSLLSKSHPFLEHLSSFCGVIDTIARANPTIAALVWGSLKLILDVFPPQPEERSYCSHFVDDCSICGCFIKGPSHV